MVQACPHCESENDEGDEVCFSCGRALSAVTQGSVIGGKYEVMSRLGKGGMGTVYKARDRVLDEIVALKVLRSDLPDFADLARRFRSEIKLARKVTHPNVCRIHEYGEDGRLRYIAMELIEGIDLKRWLREHGPFPPDDAYEAAIQVAHGLQAIHKFGIVHRDLKTPNLMRDLDGTVRLMDFGIAKRFEAETSTGATAAGHTVGTPEYMSPEQARAEKIDARSDIYALGIVIFELFTGDVPFRGDTPVATLFKHIHEPPPLDAPTGRRIPAALVPVLRKALAKSREDRYGSATEVADALAEARAQSQSSHSAPFNPIPTAVEQDAVPETTPISGPVPTPVPPMVPTPAPIVMASPAPARTPKLNVPPARPAEGLQPRPTAAGSGWLRAVGPAVAFSAATVVLFVLLVRGMPSSSVPSPAQTVTAAPTTLAAAPATSAAAVPQPSVSAPSATPLERAAGPPPLTLAYRPQSSPTNVVLPEAKSTARARRVPEDATASSVPASPAPVAPDLVPPAAAPTAGLQPAGNEEAPAVSERAAQTGTLQLLIVPWAEVEVDGVKVGISPPLKPLTLPTGAHVIRLIHPDYMPLPRRVTIRAGETARVQVDLTKEAFPK